MPSISTVANEAGLSSIWLRELKTEQAALEAVFEKIGAENRWCCEFGALDGLSGSVTLPFLRRGWQGVMIEGDKSRFARLIENLPQIGRVTPICAYVRAEGPNSLDALLSSTKAPRELDLLSVDIDNDDYYVWKAIKQYRPRVLMIEVNSQYGVDSQKIAKPGYHRFTYFTGTAIGPMVALGKAKGYELAIHVQNAIFVRRDLAGQLGVDPGNWQELFNPAYLHLSLSHQIKCAARDTLRLMLGPRFTALGRIVRRFRGPSAEGCHPPT